MTDTPSPNKSRAKKLSGLSVPLHYCKPHKVLFISDLVAAFAIAICDLFYPMITRNIINDFVPNQNLRLLLVWLSVLFGIILLKFPLNYFVTRWGHVAGVRMQADMRRDLFAHMQQLPFTFFDNNRTGSLMSRIVNDLFEISELAHHGPEDLFISIVSFLGAFLYLATINIQLTLIIFAFLPLVIFFSMFMRTRLQNAFLGRRKVNAELNTEIESSLSGIRVAKAFTNNRLEEDKFSHFNNKYVKTSGKTYAVMASYFSSMNFATDLMSFAALCAAGLFVFKGRISIGDFTAFILYISMFVQPIRRINQFVEQYQEGMSGIKRFTEIMNIEPEPNPENPIAPEEIKGDICFDDVTFSYGKAGEVLQNLSLHIPAGKTAALVGPSGGGKTTLCHLIPRFYQPQSGRILLDGVDIAQMDSRVLRSAIGIVQQDVFMFAGSIYENILYGRPDASQEEVQQAAQDANLHDFICGLPDGYDTDIGERGTKLSGGQKQRMAIARVFLKNPPVLILDEATSALDNVTEMSIQRELERLSENRTTVVVAHRLSTVRSADVIFVLTESGVLEQGSHNELIQKPNSLYRTLYETQFLGQ